MKGANEYSMIFSTGQRGRLYFVTGSHARGNTFRIFVLPAGEIAIPNGDSNAPLNVDAVEVYGVIGGNLGWTESYGWLHTGQWQEDFLDLLANKLSAISQAETNAKEIAADKIDAQKKRVAVLLSKY